VPFARLDLAPTVQRVKPHADTSNGDDRAERQLASPTVILCLQERSRVLDSELSQGPCS
jgi:hypothetical protein